ncbi:MAG: hypothetical protein RLO51_26195 [Thalassobaculum sp.]|uniref:hypothetical protein n=1 Tax=Thalassobaculum sp. TaxID=2022740 RepID=UPI0032EF3FDD
MQRRWFIVLLGSVALGLGAPGLRAPGLGVGPARADTFMALATGSLRGDPARLGWSSLRAGFRVEFPVPASGRRFMERQRDVVEAVERALGRARYDPDGGSGERERLQRLIADTVRRVAPDGTVRRVYDIWIEAR